MIARRLLDGRSMRRTSMRQTGRRPDEEQGSGHAAGLNFGDCFAYALAAATGEPLLFKGDDFSRTDVTVA